MRPSIRSRKVRNLFYTGQLTVPGPGVPPASNDTNLNSVMTGFLPLPFVVLLILQALALACDVFRRAAAAAARLTVIVFELTETP